MPAFACWIWCSVAVVLKKTGVVDCAGLKSQLEDLATALPGESLLSPTDPGGVEWHKESCCRKGLSKLCPLVI